MKHSNLLIIKLSALGDVIHALPVAHAMKQGWPAIKVNWIVQAPFNEILEGNKDIDNIILFEREKYNSLLSAVMNSGQLAAELKPYNIDISFDLQGLLKSAVVAYAAGAKVKLGYCDMREKSHWISKPVIGGRKNGHVVERYLDVVRTLGYEIEQPVFNIALSEAEKMSASNVANRCGLILEHKFIAIAPGAGWQNKRWPVKKWAEFADRIAGMNVIVAIVGAPSDTHLAQEIKGMMSKSAIDLTGQTNLKQLAGIIQKASAFVGGDTGPMHLAAAMNIPTVALMGPTDKKRNGPFGKGHKTLTVKRGCAGCWKRQCPLGYDCLSIITVEQVYAAADTMLWHFESQK